MTEQEQAQAALEDILTVEDIKTIQNIDLALGFIENKGNLPELSQAFDVVLKCAKILRRLYGTRALAAYEKMKGE